MSSIWHARGSRFKSDHLQKRGRLFVILSHIKSNCKFVKNRLPEYALSRCEEKAAGMPPAAYGGALRKAQEALERRGRFKSDHLQGYNSLSDKEL